MKILVTGGLGFIGHGVVAKLQELGHEVIIVDIMTTYGLISQDEITYLQYDRLKKLDEAKIYSVDIANASKIDEIFQAHRPEMVIHAASFPRLRVVNNNPALGSRTMIEGLLNLCESAVKWGTKRFVYISSSMIYGDYSDGATEDWRPRPRGQYAILKLAGESLVKDYASRGKFSHTIVRPSAVYGPRDVHDRVISRFMIAALQGRVIDVRGDRDLLDFTYVDDTVRGIVAVALSSNSHNSVYNITRSQAHTLLRAAQLAVEMCNSRSMIAVSPRDQLYPHRGSLSIDAAVTDTGWKPEIDLKEGLTRYRDWLMSSPYWSKKIGNDK